MKKQNIDVVGINCHNALLGAVPTHHLFFHQREPMPRPLGCNERSQKWNPANAGFFCGGAEALQPNARGVWRVLFAKLKAKSPFGFEAFAIRLVNDCAARLVIK